MSKRKRDSLDSGDESLEEGELEEEPVEASLVGSQPELRQSPRSSNDPALVATASSRSNSNSRRLGAGDADQPRLHGGAGAVLGHAELCGGSATRLESRARAAVPLDPTERLEAMERCSPSRRREHATRSPARPDSRGSRRSESARRGLPRARNGMASGGRTPWHLDGSGRQEGYFPNEADNLYRDHLYRDHMYRDYPRGMIPADARDGFGRHPHPPPLRQEQPPLHLHPPRDRRDYERRPFNHHESSGGFERPFKGRAGADVQTEARLDPRFSDRRFDPRVDFLAGPRIDDAYDRRGDDHVSPRGPPAEFSRGPPANFRRGPSADFRRGPPADFRRGPPGEFRRGPPSDYDYGSAGGFRRFADDRPGRPRPVDSNFVPRAYRRGQHGDEACGAAFSAENERSIEHDRWRARPDDADPGFADAGFFGGPRSRRPYFEGENQPRDGPYFYRNSHDGPEARLSMERGSRGRAGGGIGVGYPSIPPRGRPMSPGRREYSPGMRRSMSRNRSRGRSVSRSGSRFRNVRRSPRGSRSRSRSWGSRSYSGSSRSYSRSRSRSRSPHAARRCAEAGKSEVDSGRGRGRDAVSTRPGGRGVNGDGRGIGASNAVAAAHAVGAAHTPGAKGCACSVAAGGSCGGGERYAPAPPQTETQTSATPQENGAALDQAPPRSAAVATPNGDLSAAAAEAYAGAKESNEAPTNSDEAHAFAAAHQAAEAQRVHAVDGSEAAVDQQFVEPAPTVEPHQPAEASSPLDQQVSAGLPPSASQAAEPSDESCRQASSATAASVQSHPHQNLWVNQSAALSLPQQESPRVVAGPQQRPSGYREQPTPPAAESADAPPDAMQAHWAAMAAANANEPAAYAYYAQCQPAESGAEWSAPIAPAAAQWSAAQAQGAAALGVVRGHAAAAQSQLAAATAFAPSAAPQPSSAESILDAEERAQSAEQRDAALLLACDWRAHHLLCLPPHRVSAADAAAHALEWRALRSRALPKRLVVLCGASASAGEAEAASALLEHEELRMLAPVLDIVCVQTEEDTVQAGASDGLAELWQSMRAGHPAIALLAPCPTRRARKQLLHKLSKQSCAAAYEWEALGGKDTTGQGTPCLDEGWARILE